MESGSVLSYDLNNISFTFRGICFTNPEKVKYIFKLEGWDKSWSPETKDNAVQYSNLPAGKYTFKVRSCNNEGVWNLEPLIFKFNIDPPFWKRWWFILSLILFIIAMVIVAFRLRINQVKKQQRREAKQQVEIAKNELKALRAQMNPHFLFNSLNSIMNYIMNKNDDEAIFFLNKFARLMRLILNNSEKQQVTLSEEIDSLKLYLELEQMRFNNKFEYQIIVDAKIDAGYEEVPTMLIQPYVENAILHGLTPSKMNGNLIIELRYQGDFMVCTIKDDGIGRKKSFEMKQNQAREHKSMGMKIANDRLRLLNSINNSELSVKIDDLYDINGNAKGTSVNIFIPIIR